MTSPPPKHAAGAGEAYAAVGNALKLAGSLVVSFGITIAVRQFLIPRMLGTERFGELNFCDGFASLFMVVAWLGIDVWLRRELGVSIKTGDGIFGGVFVVRAGLAVLLGGAMALTLKLMGRSNDVVLMALVFTGAYLMVMMQTTASALLHAAGRVGGLSLTNIAGKLLWAAIVVPALIFDLPLLVLAVAFAVSEAFKAVSSMLLARAHAGLTLRVDLRATFVAMRRSMAFWVNAIALAGTGRADVAVLGTLSIGVLGSQVAANREVGWYTVVLGLSGMVMVVSPVVGWVLVPLLSRATQRGQGEAAGIIRRALEVCVVLGVPLSVGAFVAADEIIALYKPDYAPAGLVLKIMAGTFVLTYLNVVAANCLAALGRGWTVTLTSIATLVLTPLINLAAVPWALTRWGPGAGAAACGGAIVVAEVLTTGLMLRNLGRLAFDARLGSVVVRTLLTSALVLALDLLLRRMGIHPWGRVGIDAAAYVALALGTGSVRTSEARAFVLLARAQRAAGATAPP